MDLNVFLETVNGVYSLILVKIPKFCISQCILVAPSLSSRFAMWVYTRVAYRFSVNKIFILLSVDFVGNG